METIERTIVPGARVEFHGDVPQPVRAEVIKCWPHVAWMVPRWCRYIGFYWKPTADDGESASVEADFTYGHASINLTGLWLDDDFEFEVQALAHEMCHLWFEGPIRHARKVFEELLKAESPKFYATVDREIIHRTEVAVQEMSRALTERFLETPTTGLDMECQETRRVEQRGPDSFVVFGEPVVRTGTPDVAGNGTHAIANT